MSRRAALVAVVSGLLAVTHASADTLKVTAYTQDPLDHEPPLNPIARREIELTPLEVVKCDARQYDAKLAAAKVAVSLKTSPSELLKRRLDFEKSTIDGRPSVGHDGLVSREYLEANTWLANGRHVSAVQVKVGGRTHEIPAKHFVFMLVPHLKAREDFPCSVGAWWAPKEKLVAVSLSGSDGAGSWQTFAFFDADGFKGQYWNWCGNPATWCAKTLDPFPRPGGAKQYLDLVLETDPAR